MSRAVTIERIAYPRDARGLVIEPIGAVALPLQRNVHLCLTEPGGVRGNHYHERGTEITVALGPALFRHRDGDTGAVHDLQIADGDAYRFTIPPGIAHAFQNNGPAPIVLIGFNTEVHDPERPDVVRDVLIHPS
jgi:dTDP-4-dehydrorhamnose 3,5-epimerase-like enzyme